MFGFGLMQSRKDKSKTGWTCVNIKEFGQKQKNLKPILAFLFKMCTENREFLSSEDNGTTITNPDVINGTLGVKVTASMATDETPSARCSLISKSVIAC